MAHGFHAWAQTVSAMVQAGAVVFGIWFAVVQLRDHDQEQAEKRVEATDARLKELESKPIAAAVDYVLARSRESGKLNPVEFVQKIKPLSIFMSDLNRCVAVSICDEAIAREKICPIVDAYIKADLRTRPTEPNKVSVASWDDEPMDLRYGIGRICLQQDPAGTLPSSSGGIDLQ